MRPSIWYRVSSVILVLFALGHQAGFRIADPGWRAEGVIAAMKNTHFVADGMTRSYWGFFSAFGFFVTAFLLFSAFLAWKLGGLSQETLRELAPVSWALVLTFVAITVITWKYIFIIPLIFSALVTVCLIISAMTRVPPRDASR